MSKSVLGKRHSTRGRQFHAINATTEQGWVCIIGVCMYVCIYVYVFLSYIEPIIFSNKLLFSTRRCPDISDARLFKSPSISNFKLPAINHSFPTPLPLSIPFPFPSYARLFTDPGPISIGYHLCL